MKRTPFVLCAYLLLASLPLAYTQDSPPLKIYFELDQMLVIKAGVEYNFTPDWGIKGAIGLSPLSVTTWGYELAGIWHIHRPDSGFQCDLEFGLPLAYVNFFENRLVEWDPHIDSPFAGWCPGLNLVWGYRFSGGGCLGLKTGVLLIFEYQADSGWRDKAAALPEFALQYKL